MKRQIDDANDKVDRKKRDLGEKEVAKYEARQLALKTKQAGRALATTSFELRKAILNAMADILLREEKEILNINKLDQEENKHHLSSSLFARLILTSDKLKTLAQGMRDLCKIEVDPIGQVLRRTEISNMLVLEHTTTPIGVLLIIFESRPDVLPQILALAILSGNALLLKGGSEATHTNTFLKNLLGTCIEAVTKGKVSKDVISLFNTHLEIEVLLQLDDIIDLVIPRGSSKLVKYIQNTTKIPVIGHSDGICHAYVDEDADYVKALAIIIDAKTQYPAACNALETLLLHNKFNNDEGYKIIEGLKRYNVEIYGDDSVPKHWIDHTIDTYKTEYSSLGISVKIVQSMKEAIDHIHTYGSGHTDIIITENKENAEIFLNSVDSACVFHNASTRFADGYRFGLGAEVGISTGKIHARGPVGIDGLLTTKWKLVSLKISGHTVGEQPKYTHKTLETKGTVFDALQSNQS